MSGRAIFRPSARSLSALDDEQREGARQNRSASAGGGRGSEFRSGDEQAVTRRIEAHIARALRRLNVFKNVIRVRRVLMDDGERAIGVRREGLAGARIVTGTVYTR